MNFAGSVAVSPKRNLGLLPAAPAADRGGDEFDVLLLLRANDLSDLAHFASQAPAG